MPTKTKSAPKKSAKKPAKPRTIKVVEDADVKPKSAKGTKPAKADKTDKRLSAIDAAVQLLAGSKEPMTCKEMIDAMAAKGLWSSPGGKTPQATLYSSILREINTKGKDARFTKTERGKFASA